MAQDATKVHVGRAIIYTGAWVTAAGAATLVEVGHTSAPFEFAPNFENFELESEQSQGPIISRPVRQTFDIKIPIMETVARLMAEAMGQPAGNVTGTGNNLSVAVNDRIAQFHQVVAECEGPGTNALRTFKFWRCQYISMEAMQIGKSVAQQFIATLRVLRDDSVASGTGKYFQRVDS